MHNDGCSHKQITIKEVNIMLTVKKAANGIMEYHANVNYIDIRTEQKKSHER